MANERSYLFDNIKAVLIFSVVLPHYIMVSGFYTMTSIYGAIYITCFSFIMQGFFFVSGFFSKNEAKCHSTAFSSLLLPYIVFMPIMYLVRVAVFGHAHLDFLYPTHGMWFLLVMFYYRFFIKYLKNLPGLVFLSLALYFASGLVPLEDGFLALGRTLAFFIFFALGYKMNRDHIKKIRRIPKCIGALVAAGLIVFCVLCAENRIIPVNMWHLKISYDACKVSLPEGLIMRGIILLVSLGWIFVFINLLPDKKTFLSGIGRRTMTVYLMHIPVRYMVKDAILPFGGSAASLIFIILLAALSVAVFSLPIVDKAYNKAMGFLSKLCMMPVRLVTQRFHVATNCKDKRLK